MPNHVFLYRTRHIGVEQCYNDVSYLLRFLAEITSIVNGSEMTLTHSPWRKWPPFRRRHFKMHFL